MKIAQIVCVYPPYRGGIGSVAYNYKKLLVERGHSVEILTPAYQKTENTNNINYIKPLLKYGNAAFIPRLFFLLKKFDVIHLHYPFYGAQEVLWLRYAMKKINAPLIIQYHMDVDYNSLLTQTLSIPTKLILNSLFKMSNKIVCSTTDYIKQSQLKDFYNKNSHKFTEIPFGVDSNRFRPGDKENKIVNLLFVGGLDDAHYFKGLDVLIRALSKEKTKNWRLNIVGSGNLKEKFETIAKNLNINKNIEFLGNVDNDGLVRAYQDSDMFILPSINKNEAFGLVLLEAMSCGLPIIASRLPGVRKVFIDNEQGYYIDPGDEKELLNKIEKLVYNKNLREKLGKQGRELVLKKYDWEKVGEKLESLYIKTKNI